jgi:SAM-dependent methyltransferase
MTSLFLRIGFFRRRPWISRFMINGRAYGGWYDPSNDPRVAHLWRCFPDARRVLELGSLEGAHTFLIASRRGVDYVLGIEGRSANLEKARFVQRHLGARNVEFLQADLEQFRPSTRGQFDVVFCVGLLYHLQRPWELLADLRRASPSLLLATHYVPDEQATREERGYRGATYQEFGLRDPLSGLSDDSFWPTRDGLLAMVREAGYARCEVCQEETNHQHGPLLTLAAWA